MARIAVLVSNPCVADARVIKMACAAAEAGHEVHVFGTLGSGAPSFDNSGPVTYHRVEWRPLQVLRSRLPLRLLDFGPIRPVVSFLARQLVPYAKYGLFSRVFAKHVAGIRPTIIHAHDLICVKAALDAALLCDAKVMYDAHELEVHRNPPHPFLQKIWVARLERQYGRQVAAVNTVGRKVGEVLAEHLGRNDLAVLYNSPLVRSCPRHIRGELGISPDVPLFVYVGKVTMGRGVSEVLNLLPKLGGAMFAAVGPCDDKTRELLQRQADRLDVGGRFRVLPALPFDQVVDYIRGADIGVISVQPITLSYRYCMPNKLFELAFANVPIISNDLDEIREFLEENGNGEIVDFDDQAALVYTIARMLRQKERFIMNEVQLEHLWHAYSWEKQAEKLIAAYDRLLQAEPTCA